MWETTLAALPEYQAAFKQRQQTPGGHPQKKEEERPKATLTKAEDLVAQKTAQHKGFFDRARAAKTRKAEKEQWPTTKGGYRKPSGEGHKFYKDGVELTGKDKKEAYAAWHKNGKKPKWGDDWPKEKWAADSWKKGKWQS